MKWFSLRRTLCIAMIAAALSPAAMAQQTAPAPTAPPVILVVDVQLIMRESKAAKGIAQNIEQQRQVYTKEISKTEADLRAARDELERQRTILSPEAFNAKGREFQQKVDELGRNSQSKKQTLEYSHNLAMKQVLDNMLAVVSDIAVERKATVILPKDAVLLVDKGLDVTAETLQRVDQRLPTVAVNIVAPPQPGQAPAPAQASAPSGSSGKAKSGSAAKKKE